MFRLALSIIFFILGILKSDMVDVDELTKILEKHDKRISKLEHLLSSTKKLEAKKSKKISIMDLIREVKENGFYVLILPYKQEIQAQLE